EIAERYGFKCENHEYHCLSVLFGDSEKEVGIVAHLDVVPAGEGWTFDPYTLVEKDGLLIGRGAHDDKGPFIQALYTMRYFKENGIKLPFTIRLILGSDEEVGSSDLAYFRKVRKPPMFSFTPDSEFPVCIGEKSILGVNVDLGELPENVIDIHGGTVSNAVAGRAYAKIKGKVSFKDTEFVKAEADGDDTLIKAIGKTAHAAMPEAGVSAIKLLVDALIDNKIVSGDRFDFISKATAEYKGETLGIAAENVIGGNGDELRVAGVGGDGDIAAPLHIEERGKFFFRFATVDRRHRGAVDHDVRHEAGKKRLCLFRIGDVAFGEVGDQQILIVEFFLQGAPEHS
ncbi:MAG: M20/M25/M40 family metallo-hydrolase, partial [Clostridiales bacterium]|nr:M20/M25/M40 family metallo-hydrolase [Candidatus Coliplasma equi]